jgi:hypothetical protein
VTDFDNYEEMMQTVTTEKGATKVCVDVVDEARDERVDASCGSFADQFHEGAGQESEPELTISERA